MFKLNDFKIFFSNSSTKIDSIQAPNFKIFKNECSYFNDDDDVMSFCKKTCVSLNYFSTISNIFENDYFNFIDGKIAGDFLINDKKYLHFCPRCKNNFCYKCFNEESNWWRFGNLEDDSKKILYFPGAYCCTDCCQEITYENEQVNLKKFKKNWRFRKLKRVLGLIDIDCFGGENKKRKLEELELKDPELEDYIKEKEIKKFNETEVYQSINY
jgi:hypothetical protein